MSLESAKAYIEKLKTDGDFRGKIAKAKKAERAKLIKEAGFSFTEEEVHKAKGEVSVEALDNVAGGSSWSCWIDGHCGQTHEGASAEILQETASSAVDAAAG